MTRISEEIAMEENKTPFVLIVGGLDPSGGAGIQMDLATLTTCGVRALSAVSALTVQNSQGIARVIPTQPDDLFCQISACLDDFPVTWIKTGVLPSASLVRTVAMIVKSYKLKSVVDPIFASGKGYQFTDEETVQAYIKELCPVATILTPNLNELRHVDLILHRNQPTSQDPVKVVERLGRRWNTTILAKGGHDTGSEVVDLLWHKAEILRFSRLRFPHKEIHGSGCFLASAITAFCARGLPIPIAVADVEFLFELAVKGSYTWHNTTFLNPLQFPALHAHETLVIEEVSQVVSTLEKHPAGITMIPEVRSNVSIIALGGTNQEHIAAVDGRITIIKGRPCAAGSVGFRCSDHTARLLLAVRQVDPRIRAVMNLRYSPKNLEACKKAGLLCMEVIRRHEPLQQKTKEYETMAWIPSQVSFNRGRFPDVVYDTGDVGKEPMIRLFADSGIELAKKLLKILNQRAL